MTEETKSNLKAGFIGALLFGVAIWGYRALRQAGSEDFRKKKSISGFKKRKK